MRGQIHSRRHPDGSRPPFTSHERSSTPGSWLHIWWQSTWPVLLLLAAINFLQENHLPEHAAELGEWFKSQLSTIQSPLIREVRGKGLMVGIELKQKVTPYLQKLMENGVMAQPAGLTVMRFLPPLVITQSDLETVVCKVRQTS